MSSPKQDGEPIRNLNRDDYERKKAAKAREERREELNKERYIKGLPPLKGDEDRAQPAAPKELLKARSSKLKLEATLGKTQIVQSLGTKQPGFYCEVCDVTLKDNISYMDHINGRKHLSELGISQRVERSTLEQVKAKLAELKQRKEAPKRYDLDERVAAALKLEEEEREVKRQKKAEKRQRKNGVKADEPPPPVDQDMASLMGIGGFGSTKQR